MISGGDVLGQSGCGGHLADADGPRYFDGRMNGVHFALVISRFCALDENFEISHSLPGIISMVSFFPTLTAFPFCQGYSR